MSRSLINRLNPTRLPVVLALLTLLFMLPFLRPPTGNEVLDGHDLLYQQYPLYSFIFDSVRSGQGLPLWNPYQFAGQSIVANPQSTIFYPPAWIMAIIGVPRGVGWLMLLHLWLGGWGMAVFVRRLGASSAGALAGGIIYEFSGLMAAHLYAGHVNYLLCAAWLPWVAAAYLRSVESPRWLLASLLGAAAFGLAILAGHPPMLYFGGLWLAVMVLSVLFFSPSPLQWRGDWGVRSKTALCPLLIILIGGAILGAALLLPVGDFTLRSSRAESSLGFSGSYALPGAQLLTLLIPNLFGEPRHGYWGLPFYEELTAYVGVLPLIALFVSRRRPAVWMLAAFVVIGLVISLGIDGGLFPFLYYLLPGYGLFRVPARALYFVTIGGAGLGALLVTDLQTLTPDERARLLRPAVRWLLPLLALLLLIGAFVLSVYFNAHSADENPPGRVFHSANMTMLAALAVGATWLVLRLWSSSVEIEPRHLLFLTILVALLDVWRISSPLVTVSTVDVPQWWQVMARAVPASPDFRVMTVPNNIIWQAGAAYTRHLNASGYDPLVSGDFQRLLDASGYNPTSPIARLLGVRYVIADKPYEWSGLSGGDLLTLLKQEGDWRIYEVANSFPRVFIVSSVLVITDDASALEQIASGKIDPLTTALVDHEVSCISSANQSFSSLIAMEKGRGGEIVYYTPNGVEISAHADHPGLLVLTDSYDPNWTVTVDGQPADLLRVDSALRGVCLPAGEHRVRFEYQPTLFYVGVGMSVVGWITLTGAGLVFLFLQFRKRRRA